MFVALQHIILRLYVNNTCQRNALNKPQYLLSIKVANSMLSTFTNIQYILILYTIFYTKALKANSLSGYYDILPIRF